MANKHKKKVGKFQSDEFTNYMKTLLANIRFASLDTPIKTIVVTSSVMDEGKSTCASNLACAMASSGKRTLIVDADLRRRSLGSMMNQHNEKGIYSVLSGEASLRDAVAATPIPNLFFMDCETNVANPADVFATKRFAVLMDKLRESFDYVIFDMPPIGLFVDAAVASNLADGTLLVVRQNFTKRDMVEKAISQLNAAEANVLGIVLTFSEESKSNYYYYYYYNSDGERTKKSRHRQKDNTILEEEQPSEVTIGALSDDNINDWMKEADIQLSEPSSALSRSGASRSIAHGTQKAPASARTETTRRQAADPFAPGAYRSSGAAQGGTARHGRHHRS